MKFLIDLQRWTFISMASKTAWQVKEHGKYTRKI